MRRGRRARRAARSGAQLAVLFAAIGHAPRATAAEIALDGPAACVARDELTFQVERAIGRSLEQAPADRFVVHVQEAKAGASAQIEITEAEASEGRGSRWLSAKTCDELTQQVALAIALALGLHADGEAEVPAAPAAAPREDGAALEEAAPSAEVAPSARATAEPSRGPELTGSAWLLGDTGTLPAMGWGLGLGVELGWPSVALRALGTLLPEREGNLDGDAGSPGVEIGLWAGSLLACLPVAREPAPIALSICAGGELGELSGNGTRVTVPYQQRTLWAAARVDVFARWRLEKTPLAIEGLVTVAAPLRRDDFVLQDIGSVHRPESVLGRAGVGLSLFLDGGAP